MPGTIASYYYINTATIEVFTERLNADSKIKQLIYTLSEATEFYGVPIRHGEDPILRQISETLPYRIDKPDFNEPATKTNILLQSHFSRTPLNPDFVYDQQQGKMSILIIIV